MLRIVLFFIEYLYESYIKFVQTALVILHNVRIEFVVADVTIWFREELIIFISYFRL